MGPICGRQDPGGPHVGPMNFAIWVGICKHCDAIAQSAQKKLVSQYDSMHVYLYYIWLTYNPRISAINCSE